MADQITCKREKGFSLWELTLGLALSGILSVMLLSVLTLTGRKLEETRETVSLERESRRIRHLVRKHWRESIHNYLNGEPGLSVHADNGRIMEIRMHRWHPAQGSRYCRYLRVEDSWNIVERNEAKRRLSPKFAIEFTIPRTSPKYSARPDMHWVEAGDLTKSDMSGPIRVTLQARNDSGFRRTFWLYPRPAILNLLDEPHQR